LVVIAKEKKEQSCHVTFIPGIWTQSIAVPVAFERNSVRVSSAIERSLEHENKSSFRKGRWRKGKVSSMNSSLATRSDFLTQKGYLHPLEGFEG
jgi:hypothetical protein